MIMKLKRNTKYTGMDDVARKESIIWAADEENPDFKL